MNKRERHRMIKQQSGSREQLKELLAQYSGTTNIFEREKLRDQIMKLANALQLIRK